MKNVSDKSYREKQNTHFKCNISFNRAVYEIMWKNIAEPGRPQMTIWHTRIACWIPKATYTNSDYVILISFRGNYGYIKASQCMEHRLSCCHQITQTLLTTKCLRRRFVMLNKKDVLLVLRFRMHGSLLTRPLNFILLWLFLRQRTCSHLFPSISYFTFHPLWN